MLQPRGIDDSEKKMQKEGYVMNQAIQCTQIPVKQKYWFLRTMNGKYFNSYIAGSYIAIDYPEIKAADVADFKTKRKLRSYLKENYPIIHNAKFAATTLFSFINDMSIGDVVVIPSSRSKAFAFGIIESEPYEVQKDEICPFLKRRKVMWLNRCTELSVNRKFLNIKNSHETIVDAQNYSEYIDDMIGGSFYVKDNTANLIVAAGEDGNIPLVDLNNLLSRILSFAKTSDPNFDVNSLQIKINLQSRGSFKLIGGFTLLSMLALVIFATTKNEITFTNQIDFKPLEGKASNTTTFQLKGPSLIEAYDQHKMNEIKIEAEKLFIEKEKLKVEAMKRSLLSTDENKTNAQAQP